MKPASFDLKRKSQRKASDNSYRYIDGNAAYQAGDSVYANELDEVVLSLWIEIWQKHS